MVLNTNRDHWAHQEVAALRLQCAWRGQMEKRKLSRKKLMFSVEGLRILYDMLDEVMVASIVAAELKLEHIRRARSIQACWRGHKGRLTAKTRVSEGLFFISLQL